MLGFKLIYVKTDWGRVPHICVTKLTIIGSDNGLSPGRRQAIIWASVGILLIRTLGTNFSEIFIEIHTFSYKKIDLKMLSGKWRPSCLGLNMLIERAPGMPIAHVQSVTINFLRYVRFTSSRPHSTTVTITIHFLNIFGTVSYTPLSSNTYHVYPLQWSHMSDKAFQITGTSIVCS